MTTILKEEDDEYKHMNKDEGEAVICERAVTMGLLIKTVTRNRENFFVSFMLTC